MTTRQQTLELFQSDDLIALGMEADAVRRRLHPEGLVTYCLETAEPSPAQPVVEIMSFSAGESLSSISARLTALRERQKETSALKGVLPLSEGTAVEHLKVLALARIYLDNIAHICASWAFGANISSGAKICQIALRFGADDISGAEAGELRATQEETRRLIRDAGFIPKQRDPLFRTYFLN